MTNTLRMAQRTIEPSFAKSVPAIRKLIHVSANFLQGYLKLFPETRRQSYRTLVYNWIFGELWKFSILPSNERTTEWQLIQSIKNNLSTLKMIPSSKETKRYFRFQMFATLATFIHFFSVKSILPAVLSVLNIFNICLFTFS